MNRSIAWHSLQSHGQIQQPSDLTVFAVHPLQRRRFQCLPHRDIQFARNRLGHRIHLGIRHAEHPPHIPHGGTGSQRSESDNLRDMIPAVTATDIINHLIPADITKVHINIRHTNPFRIEKPLKKQVKTDRIHIGNAQQIGHQAPRTGSAPRTHRNLFAFGKTDIVLHDQEIIVIPHTADYRKFVFHPFPVHPFFVMDKIKFSRRFAPLKTKQRQCAQVTFGALSRRHGKFRQMNLPETEIKPATLGNPGAVFDRFRISRKKRCHFLGGFIVEFLGFKPDGGAVRKARVGLNGQKHRLRFGVLLFKVVTVIGGHHRQPKSSGERNQHREDLAFFRQTVVLKLNIKMIRPENIRKGLGGTLGLFGVSGNQRARDLPGKAGRQRNKSLVITEKQFHIHPRFGIEAFRKGQ